MNHHCLRDEDDFPQERITNVSLFPAFLDETLLNTSFNHDCDFGPFCNIPARYGCSARSIPEHELPVVLVMTARQPDATDPARTSI
jgi:hypothetical protein